METLPAHAPVTLEGPRLRLRPWQDADLAPLAAMNGDVETMRWFQHPLSREQSDAWGARMRQHGEAMGWTMWPVERRDTPGLIGVVGLLPIAWEAHFTPAVEIGWRIAPTQLRQGYAEEAARLALGHGFSALRLASIVAFTVPGNDASWRLMEKLGMRPDGDFLHPRLPPGHPYERHLLYRIDNPHAS